MSNFGKNFSMYDYDLSTEIIKQNNEYCKIL